MIMEKIAKILALLAVVIMITGCKKLPEFHDGNSDGGGVTTIIYPELSMVNVENITEKSAVFIGYVSNYNLVNVDEYNPGFCWNTTGTPTIDDHVVEFDVSSSLFNGTLQYTETSLTPNTRYYIRMYAKSRVNDKYTMEITYGEEISFLTLSNGDEPTGSINGLFSVSDTKQVYFSQGNLQYQASMNKWRFAENQYDYVGEANSNISSYYDGWIDLFGWGTSGYNHGAVCYQPWSTSENNSDYYAYGYYSYNLSDQTGQADWGYNPISNGGNNFRLWRTLTNEEWVYLINTRNTSSGIKYAKAQVNDIKGVILLPDSWSSDTYSLSNTNTSYAAFTTNVITTTNWSILEQAGAVFLPAAGYRINTTMNYLGSQGRYWSTTIFNGNYACDIIFASDFDLEDHESRYIGTSVRLVHDAN